MRRPFIFAMLGFVVLFGASGCGGSPGKTLPGSEVSWEEIGNLRNLNLSGAERAKVREKYLFKMVKWRGEVTGGGFGGVSFQVQMTSDGWSKVDVYLKDAEKQKASHLRKGDTVSFAGRLQAFHMDASGANVRDAEILK